MAAAIVAEKFLSRSLDSPELQDYMRAQGYPKDAIPTARWGLTELTLAAFFFHPQLDVARSRSQSADAAIITAGQKPNPGVSASAEHHSKTEGGISPWTLGFSLDIPLETGNKRALRIEQATRLSEAAAIEIGQTAWNIRSQLRAALTDYFAAEEQAALLQQEAALRGEIVAMLDKRLSAGMISNSELAHAGLQLQKLQQALEAEKARLPGLRASIATAAGLPAQALASVQLDPDGIDTVVAREQIPGEAMQRAALLNRLDIRAELVRYAAAESALQLEIARQRPDLVLTPGYSFDQGDNRWSLGLSLILALLNKNEGPIAEAEARREAMAARFNALQARVIGEQEQALAGYLAALDELAKAERMLAAHRKQQAAGARQFEAGYIDRLELAAGKLQALTAEQGVIAARFRLRQKQGQLEDALQRPLDNRAVPPAPPRIPPR